MAGFVIKLFSHIIYLKHMFSKKSIAAIAIILAAFAVGIYLYPQLPEKMATHWNARGEADGYSGKLFGAFFVPAIMAIFGAILHFIPKIDPLGKNIVEFKNYYENFILIMLGFMLAVYLQTLLWSLGTQIPPNLTFPILIGALFFYLGHMLEKSKMNWSIDIRTPWTLSSEKVWEKTHKVGGKMFKASALISFAGVFFGEYAIWFILFPVLLTAAFTFIYSYLEYKKEAQKKL